MSPSSIFLTTPSFLPPSPLFPSRRPRLATPRRAFLHACLSSHSPPISRPEEPYPPATSPPSLPRRTLLSFLSLTLVALPLRTLARGVPPHSLPRRLSRADLPAAWPYVSADFARVDSKPDARFYERPRVGVRHVDVYAVEALRKYFVALVKAERAGAVLDLCASAETYLEGKVERVAGLGMNAEEMQANEALSEWVVVDLNEAAKTGGDLLPYGDGEFDVVLCALSIDYLTSPREVLRDVSRVLRPGGVLAVAFSDRLFATKAVALWTGEGDAGHVDVVATYIAFSGGQFDLDAIDVLDLSPRKDGGKSDPLFVVQVRKLPEAAGPGR